MTSFSLERQIKEVLSQRLSPIIAGAVLNSACQRCSLEPKRLTIDDIPNIALALERSLACYLEPGEVRLCLRDLHRLAGVRKRPSSLKMTKPHILKLESEVDVHRSRTMTMELVKECGHGTYEAVKIATVVSELVRNVLMYAQRGTLTLHRLSSSRKHGIRVVVQDNGPGIEHLDEIMAGTYRSSTGRSKGIHASRRIMDSFVIETSPDKGTTITAEKLF